MLKMRTLVMAGLMGLCAAAPSAARAAGSAAAATDAVKVVGYLIKIDAAADGKSAVATLLVKGKKLAILVTDELTLKKFKVNKIRTDDEIKCTYKVVDGKNLSVSFLRAAGC